MSAMDKLALGGVGVGFLIVAGTLVLYEYLRMKAGRPILNGNSVIQLYHCAYLSSFVLAVTFLIAAAVK